MEAVTPLVPDFDKLVACTVTGHARSSVRRNGTQRRGGLIYQRYICQPTNRDTAHSFWSEMLPIAAAFGRASRRW